MQIIRTVKIIIASFLLLLLWGCSIPAGVTTQSPVPVASQESKPSSTPAITQDSEPLIICPTPSPSPSFTIQTDQPIVLISWDGLGDLQLRKLVQSGLLPTFSNIIDDKYIRAMRSIQPPLTAPVHASMVSGVLPQHNGIVSNQFHNSNDSFYWYRQGLEEPMNSVVPVWVLASQAGKKTATVFFPGTSMSNPLQIADLSIGYGIRDAYSRQEELILEDTEAWEGMPITYSQPKEGIYHIPGVATVYALILDSSNDGSINYDLVALNTHRIVASDTPLLRSGDHNRLILIPSSHSGAEFLIQNITERAITIYQSGVYHNIAVPRPLLAALNERYGFFQAGPDTYALEHGWIDEWEYLYQIRAQSLWMANVAAWVHQEYSPDLMLTWQGVFDEAGHTFLLVDPSQFEYSAERSEAYNLYYQQAAISADDAMQIIFNSIKDETTLLLVSDHGMSYVHTNIYINSVLERAGLLVLDKRDYVVENRSKAFGVASGGTVNIYINLEGREINGIVPSENYHEVRTKIVELLRELRDPRTGEAVFQDILIRDELSMVGLDHEHSGDVWAQTKPGYTLDGWRGKNIVFEPSKIYGQHGYNADFTEMNAFLIVQGNTLNPKRQIKNDVSILDIAPTLLDLLNLSLPEWMDGETIFLDIP